MAYAPVTVTGYNANPPPDDGTAVALNEVAWSKHIAKIGDPLKTAIDGIQTAIAAAVDPLDTSLKAPVGTVMIFRQTAAPTGWTKLTTHDQHALRCVSGTVGTGGTADFTTVFAARTVAQTNLPAVTWPKTLAVGIGTLGISGTGGFDVAGWSGAAAFQDNVPVGGSNNNMPKNCVARTLGVNGSPALTGDTTSGGSGTAMDFAVKYIDVIEASKN